MDRPATLDVVPDAELDKLKAKGLDWLWLLSVWSTGDAGKKISQQHPGWQQEFAETLPDLKPEDIAGSGFAIAGYQVHPALGGNEALQRFRQRLRVRGIKLMLDFVPNHMGPDHPWVQQHSEYFMQGTEDDLLKQPQNYTRVPSATEEVIMAYGRDPYFDGWPDTVQLDYSNPDTAAAMQAELVRIAGQCDGLRCDMAMLVLPEVFERTWGRRAQPFWPRVIDQVRNLYPGFCFMAEVYWDMEYTLQQLGFDYTYDKRLHDRLHAGVATPVREHLHAALDFQQRSVRFLENHDEPRVAAAFNMPMHLAAAVITYTVPGIRFFHQGQLHGFTKRISPHLTRGPKEVVNGAILNFYQGLLAHISQRVFRSGEWQSMECVAAWPGNRTWQDFIAHAWQDDDTERIVVVNYSLHASQCRLLFPFPDLAGNEWRFTDLMGDAVYDRNGNELQYIGLYLDMEPWQYHVFEMKRLKPCD